MRERFDPDIFGLVDGHCQLKLLGHRMVDMVYPSVAVRVAGAGGTFPNPEKLVDGVRRL